MFLRWRGDRVSAIHGRAQRRNLAGRRNLLHAWDIAGREFAEHDDIVGTNLLSLPVCGDQPGNNRPLVLLADLFRDTCLAAPDFRMALLGADSASILGDITNRAVLSDFDGRIVA